MLVRTEVWTKAECPHNSTKETRELDRRDTYLSYAVTTEDVKGETVGHRRISYYQQPGGSITVSDFDGKSIRDFVIEA